MLSLLAGDESVWIRSAAPLIDRFGQRIRHWQLGAPVPDAPLEPTDLAGSLDTITASLAGMIPGPIIDIPWHTDDLFDPTASRWGRDLTLLGVPGEDPESYALLARDGKPHLWDFGSAAKHHRLFAPWLHEGHSHAGMLGLRGAIHPEVGLMKEAVTTIKGLLHDPGLDGLPIGVQFSALQGDEKTLLELAFELEQARPWRRIQD